MRGAQICQYCMVSLRVIRSSLSYRLTWKLAHIAAQVVAQPVQG